MRTLIALSTVSLGLLLAAGCTPQDSQPNADDFAAALPDSRILVNMPVSANRAVGDTAESYMTAAQVTTDVNGLISEVLESVDRITDFDPTWSGENNEFFWGPWNDGGLDPNQTALYVEYDEVANVYGWAIVQRPKDSTSDDDWVGVIGGESIPGATEDEFSGSFGIDYDAIAALNPASTEAGVFYSAYEVSPTGVVAEAGFEGFTDDSSNPERIDAGYRYGQDLDGNGYMDLGYLADIGEDGSQDETIVLRARWLADGQGRGDTVVFGGDLDPLAYQGTECWGTDYSVVYEENNFDMVMDGDESLCAFAEPEWNDDAPAQ